MHNTKINKLTARPATITELWKFPIKGCQGIKVNSLEVSPAGVKGDRDFAFWSEGKIIDQKCTPKLASIAAYVNEDNSVLTLTNPEFGEFSHTINPNGEKLKTTQILDKYESVDQGDLVSAWASQIVGKDIKLVIPGDSWLINLSVKSLVDMHQKQKQKFYAVSSVSLLNRSSLFALNDLIDNPVDLDRFRSNIVVDGMEAWDEDEMGEIFTTNVKMNHMSGAERCIIIATDQKSGERPKNNILQTLKKHRSRPKEDRFASGLLFGSYMSVVKAGVLNVGDVFQHGAPPIQVDKIISSKNISESPAVSMEHQENLSGAWMFTLKGTPAGEQTFTIQFEFIEDSFKGVVTESTMIKGS